ncbi:helix-turn-helix domain-containing protein [Paenibacillus hamazuiensis]|uniref:helix-turn-helix domain-containing protein n=1 Tax=Paenibacillus hamazuiensis TaxID=2936508 RepID=UPI00200DE3C1|nr:helix-turn-helix domain-containing protein [Paenibacillus hamazuiensis]
MNKSTTVPAYGADRGAGKRADWDRELAGLIRSGRIRPEEFRARLTNLGIRAYFSYPTLALFELSPNPPHAGPADSGILEACEAIERNAPAGCITFIDEPSRIGMIFSWDDREKLHRLHGILQNHYSQPFSGTVTTAIGNPCRHLSDLHIGYNQAASALTHKYYQGIAEIIYFSSVKPFSSEVKYPDDKEEELFQLIQGGRTANAVERAVDAFYEALLQGGLPKPEQVNDASAHLLISLELRIKTYARESPTVKPDIMAVLQTQTLDEMKRSVCGYVKSVSDCFSRDGLQRTIIKKALALMENEYDKASLPYVAEKVFITPAYLSTLFKTNMGVTFIEHLTDIRIGNAKRLLRQTHLKNYEVAEKVGYHDSRYFSQIFKKKVGLSPSEFRDAN